MTDQLPDRSLFDWGGTFFPSNSVVAFFDSEGDARAVQADINAVLPDAACEVYSPGKVDAWSTEGMETAGVIAALGHGIKIVEIHQTLARQGKWSILAYAPGEENTEVAMVAIRKKPFHQANKYNQLTVEDLS